jgi:hypothetical protein
MALVLVAAGLSGCGPYTRAEIGLVDQARRGVALCQRRAPAREEVVEKLYELRGRMLDEAFDADVREQPALSAGWVVEHRRAYAAALAAIREEREKLRAAEEADRRNLGAVDAVLVRLRWMQEIELGAFDVTKEAIREADQH